MHFPELTVKKQRDILAGELERIRKEGVFLFNDPFPRRVEMVLLDIKEEKGKKYA